MCEKGRFRVGDKVKIEGEVVRVYDSGQVTIKTRATIELYLNAYYMDLVERPPSPPKVGDVLKSDRGNNITTATIMAIDGDNWWVKWSTGGYSTMGAHNLGAHNVRVPA